MENNGRKIIVSKFEIVPFDPIDFNDAYDELCCGQLIIDKEKETITFKFLSGEQPLLYHLLAAMSVSKQWFKVTSSEKAISNFQEHILLERECPHEFYIAHYGEDGLPVIDHKIDFDGFIEVDEFTLTALEYNLLAEVNGITIANGKHRRRRRYYMKKEFRLRFIK